MIIRREIAEDLGSVEAVTSAAFAVGGSVQEPPETRLLRSLRRHSGWIPILSMVAVHDERIVGHVADAAGEPLIALLGDPHFYSRFGFMPASRLGIDAPHPEWGEHFQARPLTDCPPSVAGAFQYAAPFARL